MASDLGEKRLAAIVFTDMVSFSAQMGRDEEATLRLIRRDTDVIKALAERFNGQVIKSTGDGHLLYFSSAGDAVGCGVEFLKSTSTQTPPLQYRIGIHLGDVFVRDGDVMGDGVNIAARLQSEAEPGGICMSQTVYDVVKNRLTVTATYVGAKELKNIREPISMYRLDPSGPARVMTVKVGGDSKGLLMAVAVGVIAVVLIGAYWLRNPKVPPTAAATLPTSAPTSTVAVDDPLAQFAEMKAAMKQKLVTFCVERLKPNTREKPLELLYLPNVPTSRRGPPMTVWMEGSLVHCRTTSGTRSLKPDEIDGAIASRLVYTLIEQSSPGDTEVESMREILKETWPSKHPRQK